MATPPVQMRLPADLVVDLDRRAKREGSNRTALVVAACRYYLAAAGYKCPARDANGPCPRRFGSENATCPDHGRKAVKL